LQTPIVVTANFSYYRLRRSEYGADDREAIALRMSRGIKAGRELFAFYKHEDSPDGALYAEELLRDAKLAAA
jgi:predicted transcriptional regulator